MGKQNVKLVVAIALLVLAAIIFFVTRGDSEQEKYLAELNKPKDLICNDCGHVFQLSAQETKAAFDAVPAPTLPDTGTGRTRRDAARLPPKMIKCPSCGKDAVVLAVKCPTHGEFFPSVRPDGSKGACPKCASGE